MNILIASVYSYNSYSRGIMPDVLQTQIDQNPEARIFYLTNSGSFDLCYFNIEKRPEHCYRCKTGVKDTLKLIKGEFEHIIISDLVEASDLEKAKTFLRGKNPLEMDLIYENFEVGAATLSTYISRTRDRDLDQVDQGLVEELAINSLGLYLAIKRFLKEKEIDLVYNFNGRHGYVRAIMRAAQATEINCFNVERARLGGYLDFYKNVLPHHIATKKQLVDSCWENSLESHQEKVRVASSFFERQRQGESVIFPSYLKNQARELLPEGINNGNQNVVLFNSSDDEFAAMGEEFRNPIFRDQLDGIDYLADLFGKKYPHLNLIIRMHPNLAGITFSYAENIRKKHQSYPNIFVVPPESRIDSYALMNSALKIITFGSTLGLEATYNAKPSILLGKCFYYYSEVAYTPRTKEEIKDLLDSELPPKPLENALRFGYFYLKGGVKSKYYHEEKMGEGIFFKGRRIHTYSLLQRIYSKIIEKSYQLFGIRLKG